MPHLFYLLAISLLLAGCNAKQYYTPSSIEGQIEPLRSPYPIMVQQRQGATLKGGKVLNATGVSEYHLPDGCVFLNENTTFALATCEQKKDDEPFKLLVLNKDSLQEHYLSYQHKPLAVNIQNELLAVVLANNVLLLQRLQDEKILFEQKEKLISSINALSANPVFLRGLAIFPTLDGALLIVDTRTLKVVRRVSIANNEYFNNITFLDIFNNRLIAATKFKTVSVSPEYINTYDINLRDILVLRDRIYLFSAEGEVIQSDHDLNVQKKLKFPFAHFLAAGVGEELVVLENRGYMIVMDIDLKSYRVYSITRDINYPIFGNNEAIYFGDFYIKIK